MKTRMCSQCKIKKDLFKFSQNKHNKFNKGYICKKCFNIYAKSYRIKNRKKINKNARKYYQNHKEEIKKANRKYYQEHKEYRNQQDRIYYKNHREERKKYCKENRNKINKYENQKYHSDINFNIAMKLRARLRGVLKNKHKYSSVIKMLGCSFKDFKNHFISKFTKGMTWKKFMQGKIHIDHITPLSSFDLSIEKNQYEACHFSNIQPLWASANLRKSKKVR